MPTRRCSSCSAVVELPENVFSARCSFCDNPLVDVEMTVAAPPGTCWSASTNTVQVAVTATDCAGASSTSTSTAVYVCGNL